MPYILAVLFLFGLTGCGGDIRESLGLGKSVPDEFAVATHAPLSLPPDYHLRAPVPGAARPQQLSPVAQAQSGVFGRNPDREVQAAVLSGGEAALLRNAGTQAADPVVRQQLEAKQGRTEEDPSFLGSLFGYGQDATVNQVVDPNAELRRVRDASADGRSATGDGVPTVEEKKGGFWDWLF